MHEIEFYQSHLDRVSRSFAFCIRKLDPPFRQWTSLSYLLCRVLDTVEDSRWPDPRLKAAQFREFESFLMREPSPERVRQWSARFDASIPESEEKLLADAHALFEDLHFLPEGARAAIQDTVQLMSAGMKYYSERSTGGELRLRDLKDVNRYCYFVAGVVGELLTRLLMNYRPDFSPDERFMRNAFHFGLFLQKVNLIKDQAGDEKEGRYLVPDREQVLASLSENAQGALEYILTLPREEVGYRTFCAWSFYLGGASIAWIEKSRAESGAATKIPRAVTEELLAAIEKIVQDNEALQAGYDEYFPKLPELKATSLAAGEDGWFSKVALGPLSRDDLAELRMI